ncbi:Pentatricopeptide repeat-containing protein 2 mitochondrial [Dissostichus eleginoides]|uniref:Pentatricopeptide repeat-containing protein 2 mitochondrial n=1 Tax=Dissostichus eleginoides TaxID=100907 RepID=A0AAD9F0H3_DISEL|nr:Pentatricopeptide repeat-containing protein 2 mitochondrial [Dissostichus eleginoides]
MVRILVSIIMACSFNLPGTCISERQHTQALAEALGHPDSLIYCVYHFMVCRPRDGSSTCADDSLTLDRLWCHTIPPTVHLSPTLRSTGAGLIHNKTMMHVFQSAAFRVSFWGAEDVGATRPLFALSCPGSDLFALWDGESVKEMEGWRGEEALHLYKVSGTIQARRL